MSLKTENDPGICLRYDGCGLNFTVAIDCTLTFSWKWAEQFFRWKTERAVFLNESLCLKLVKYTLTTELSYDKMNTTSLNMGPRQSEQCHQHIVHVVHSCSFPKVRCVDIVQTGGESRFSCDSNSGSEGRLASPLLVYRTRDLEYNSSMMKLTMG